MTSTSSPPRIGSGHGEDRLEHAVRVRRPSAWFVLEPSKPQIGGFLPSATIFVLQRSLRGRLGAVDPDVFSLIRQRCSLGEWPRAHATATSLIGARACRPPSSVNGV